jgi:hypothetical protein
MRAFLSMRISGGGYIDRINENEQVNKSIGIEINWALKQPPRTRTTYYLEDEIGDEGRCFIFSKMIFLFT